MVAPVVLTVPSVASASGWSAPVPIDPYVPGTSISCTRLRVLRRGDGLVSIACPTTSFCVALDYRGRALISRR